MDTTKTQIILAEDNPDHAQLLIRALTWSHGSVEVTAVRTGEAFLQAIASRRFDCAVLDFNLPDVTADHLLERARQLLGDCPSLVISSSQEQSVVVAAIRKGSVDFVHKEDAFRSNELARRVRAAISRTQGRLRKRRKADRRQRHLQKLADTDQLTGLHNRRYFDRCLADGRWDRERRRLAVVMIDIDHFKAVNDQHGHLVGDQVLRATARTIRRCCRPQDAAVRWGGEELLILRPTRDELEALIWAQRLRRAVADQHVNEADQPAATVSVGLGFVDSQRTFDLGCIAEADEALYLAKSMGRNIVCTGWSTQVAGTVELVASSGLGPETGRRLLLEHLAPHLGRGQKMHVGRHCENVAARAGQLAQRMGLDEQRTEAVRLAALYHDIGKCFVPERLISLARPLAAEELAVVELRVPFGRWLARRLGADAQVASAITGSIDATQASPDPQADEAAASSADVARIVSVADALDTMTSGRPYQKAIPFEQAARELRAHSGEQFDRRVVEAVEVEVEAQPQEMRQAA